MQFWRFPSTAGAGPVPDWVVPFLDVDTDWSQGRAEAHTSGSTGTPKRISFDRQAVKASAHATARHFQLNGGVRTLETWSALPVAGIGGRMMWWRARILGWSLTQSRPSARPDAPLPEREARYDFGVATPQQAAHLAESGQLDRFSTLLLGGGALSPSLEFTLQAAATAAGVDLHLGFGMTETLTHVATRRLGSPVYVPLLGVLWSLDAEGGLVLDVVDRGVHQLATRDAVDAATDPETGQPGFRWLGRLDDVINTGGLKVHPAALERALDPIIRHHVGPRRWYLAGRPHDITGSEVTLILEGPQDPQLGPALLSALANAHPHPDRPRNVVWMDRFEETATGKVRRC